MESYEIRAKITELTLPRTEPHNESVVITGVKGSRLFKYKNHGYYFLNFQTGKGFCIEISHKDIVWPGIKRFKKANDNKFGWLFQKYHYGFNLIEQMMLMTLPHTVVYVGDSRFIVNLFAYFGYLVIDCSKRTVQYHIIEEQDDDHILGSQQWFDPDTGEIYYMTYSLKDSLKRSVDPYHKVSSRILKRDNLTGKGKVIWQDDFVDNLHDIHINKNKQYCVVPEFGMFSDDKGNLIPSKVLILDLKNQKNWIIPGFMVAAHAEFDPDDQDIVYISNHNFRFYHNNLFSLLKTSAYSIKFYGPASIDKYQLTQTGPRKLDVFSHPDMFRQTNFHVFNHQGRVVLAAMGTPNFIFLAEAKNMKFIKKIEVKNQGAPSFIGTFSVSNDGERLYVQTTRSFQVINVSTGRPEMVMDYETEQACSNHMITSTDTKW